MPTRLTLTVEKQIIERAKVYAKSTGRSLSEIIENYLENITNDYDDADVSPKLRNIVGAIQLPKDLMKKRN